MKKEKNPTKSKKKRSFKKMFPKFLENLLLTAVIIAYFFTLQTDQVFATDMWEKAESIMKDVYNRILGISTIAAIVTAAVALLLMNFSSSGKTVDESRLWLKRIVITWAILNSLGFILAYVAPFFSDGKWNG